MPDQPQSTLVPPPPPPLGFAEGLEPGAPASASIWSAAIVAGIACGTLATLHLQGLGGALLGLGLAWFLNRHASPNMSAQGFAAGIAALSIVLVTRANPWLGWSVTGAIVVVTALLIGATATGQTPFDLRLGPVFRRLGTRSGRSPAEYVHATPAGSVFRGIVLACPIVLVLGAFLSDADPVFDAVLGSPGLLAARIAIGVGTAWVIVVLLMWLRQPVAPLGNAPRAAIGAIEACVVLAAMSLLFTFFLAVRAVAAANAIAPDAWRGEVRSGFFQLLWVAGLTIAVVVGLRSVARLQVERHQRWFRRLSWLTLVLTAGIDLIAVFRIIGYVERTLLTPLRLWSLAFAGWVLIVLALTAVRVSCIGASKRWFLGALVASWVGFVLAMAVLNPDARIANYNLDHPAPDGYVSVELLMLLSADATPAIYSRLDELVDQPRQRHDRMVEHLCLSERDDPWREFNLSRRIASQDLANLCLP